MKIHILTAEHFNVPGLICQAHATAESAAIAAAEIVNIMLNDTKWQPLAGPDNWQAHVERLQDYHGAQHCYVEIRESEVIGGTDYRGKLQEALDEWPQFDADETEPRTPGCIPDDDDVEVNGGDLVEWFGIWREQVKAMLSGTI